MSIATFPLVNANAAEPRPGRKHPRVLVVANQKGGVGKTTTAINLGTALAAVGEPTLVLDIDPQGNASTGLGVYGPDRKVTIYDVLMGEAKIADAVTPTKIPGLSLLPSTVDLSGAELELIDKPRRNYVLKDALAEFAESDANRFSYVLIDCPPSLTLLTVNAMAAAHAVVVPLQCEFFALEGLSQLLKTIDLVRGNLNPALEIQGIVLTMFDKRNRLSDQVAADVREHMGDKVYRTIIPRNVRISEAPSHGLPALVYDLRCPGSQAYIKLAGELIQRERVRAAA
ncbi:MAG TPA: ParA family protein [Rhizomicrobium sp.]|nr:ParA family protein [Rhizomicrobium sp.]